ncbi:MAG TPA: MFS transporter [Thermoleophilaceae bacterium]|jgi:EmrB/QacA subfamily drug resistance transporter
MQPTTTGHPRRWLILFVILAAECMDLLDATIVNVASPSIRLDLHATSTQLQWIVGGYALAFSVGLVTGGRLGDIFGRRRLFIIGAAGFTLSSMACSLASSPGMLIAFRLTQGAFGALMIPQGLGVVKEVFSAEELPKAFAIWGPVMGLSAVFGPIVGGALVSGNLFGSEWRSIFFVNVPLGLLGIFGAYRVMPESRSARKLSVDFGGAALFTVAAVLLVYPLIQGRDSGWPAWAFISMAASAVTLLLFASYEKRRQARGGDPLVVPSILSKPGYVSGTLITLVFFSAMAGLLLVPTLYFQIALHYSPIHSGLTVVPWAFGTAIGAGLSGGWLGPKFGRPVIQGGAVVLLGGILWMLAAIHSNGASLTSWDLAPAELLLGIGMGLVIAPLFSIILAAVNDEEVGSASGVLNAIQQLGSAVGVAVIGTVFFSALGHDGFRLATEHSLWVVAAIALLVLALTPLLPLHGRPEEELMGGGEEVEVPRSAVLVEQS